MSRGPSAVWIRKAPDEMAPRETPSTVVPPGSSTLSAQPRSASHSLNRSTISSAPPGFSSRSHHRQTHFNSRCNRCSESGTVPSRDRLVAGKMARRGNASAGVETLTPTPATIAARPFGPGGTPSQRMPAHLRPCTSRSFGHLSPAGSPVSARTPSQTPSPTAKVARGRVSIGTRGRRSVEKSSDEPGGASQVCPARPRPAV